MVYSSVFEGRSVTGPVITGKANKIFYLPTDAQESCFKGILKFRLKQLLHVSV